MARSSQVHGWFNSFSVDCNDAQSRWNFDYNYNNNNNNDNFNNNNDNIGVDQNNNNNWSNTGTHTENSRNIDNNSTNKENNISTGEQSAPFAPGYVREVVTEPEPMGENSSIFGFVDDNHDNNNYNNIDDISGSGENVDINNQNVGDDIRINDMNNIGHKHQNNHNIEHDIEPLFEAKEVKQGEEINIENNIINNNNNNQDEIKCESPREQGSVLDYQLGDRDNDHLKYVEKLDYEMTPMECKIEEFIEQYNKHPNDHTVQLQLGEKMKAMRKFKNAGLSEAIVDALDKRMHIY